MVEFQGPTFALDPMIYTGLGVVILWFKLGEKRITVFGVSRVLEQVGVSKRTSIIAEFFGVLAAGIVVVITFVQPATAEQAIAAGLGWTGLIGQATSS